MSLFTEDAGRFLHPHETKDMKKAYSDRRRTTRILEEDFVISEFFGLNQVMHLLSQPGCVGLRVHHAKRWEDKDGNPTKGADGQLRPRVLLTGVDAQGRDMPVTGLLSQTDNAGLKDMPQGDGDEQALGDGYTCPRHCADTN